MKRETMMKRFSDIERDYERAMLAPFVFAGVLFVMLLLFLFALDIRSANEREYEEYLSEQAA